MVEILCKIYLVQVGNLEGQLVFDETYAFWSFDFFVKTSAEFVDHFRQVSLRGSSFRAFLS